MKSESQDSKTSSWYFCFSALPNPFLPFVVLFCILCSKQSRYNQAKLSLHDRTLKVAAVVESLEREMELLCLTGVEDQLQADVRPTLEMLRNAGIKVLNSFLLELLNMSSIYFHKLKMQGAFDY